MGPAGPHRLQVALRPGRGPGLTGRPPGALQPMALGPAAPAYWVPGTFSRRGSWRRTGRRVRASEHARRGHARGGQTGRGAWGSTRAGSEVTGTRGHCSAHGWLLVTPEARAGAGPPRRPPALPQRTHPGTGARAPGHPGAPASCTARAPGRPPPLREPSLCSQPDKAPAPGPLHHLPETGVFVTCRWAPSPTHPHMPTHPHVPAPTGRAGRKPALLLGPSLHRHTLKVITVLHHRVTCRVPNTHGALEGELGRGPRQGCCVVGPRGLGSGLAPRPTARLSLLLPKLPARPASWEPTGLRLRPYWSVRRRFPAGRRRHAV